MQKYALVLSSLLSLSALGRENNLVSSSSSEQSAYFNPFSSSVNVIKAYRQDAFDAAMKTGTRSLREYCQNRSMILDETSIEITYQSTTLEGPEGSLRASFRTRLDLAAVCK